MISFNQKPRKTHLDVLARFLVSSEGTGPLLLTVRDRLLTGLCRGLYFKIFVLMPFTYIIILFDLFLLFTSNPVPLTDRPRCLVGNAKGDSSFPVWI